MSRPAILAVLSTGRCGTQWLAATLEALAGENLVVRHEPIGAAYAPRRHFRCYANPAEVLAEPAVAAHLDWVDTLERPYVETGWPLFAALPLMAKRWPGRLRVLHLTRHPVATALSHLAHSSYAGSDRDDPYTRLATLGPTDPRVFQAGDAGGWEALSPYERCLFWWTEVARYGLEFPGRYPHIPFLRLRSEEMLAGRRAALQALVRFVGLPWDERWIAAAGRPVDRWHHQSDREFEPLAVHRHPATVEAAQALGYDLSALDVAALRRRYVGPPHSQTVGAER